MKTLTACRPANVLSCEFRLDEECKSARWGHHRLLDFEDLHQRLLDAAAELAAPGIGRVGRILAKLTRREERQERKTKSVARKNPHLELTKRLKEILENLRKQRNANSVWSAAVEWADGAAGSATDPAIKDLLDKIHEEIVEDPFFAKAVELDWRGLEEPKKKKKARRRKAQNPSRMRQKKDETDEDYAKRFALFTTDETDEHLKKKQEEAKHTRREIYRNKLYAERRCYWGTWNALLASVDQARQAVLKRRGQGMPAEWHRPKRSGPVTLVADALGFRIVDRGKSGTHWECNEDGRTMRKVAGSPWWTVEMRIGVGGAQGHRKEPKEWVRVKTKIGNWHDIPDDIPDKDRLKVAKLTRRIEGSGWSYSLSLAVEGAEKSQPPRTSEPSGKVSFDWGHREHGHDAEHEGLRAFVWHGHDGETGEILLPIECRRMQDEIDAIKKRLDETFNARKATHELPERNRYQYRSRLEKSRVRTKEESDWLQWEMRYERRMSRRRKRIQNLRKETYINGWTDSSGVYRPGIRWLRDKYVEFVFEGERIHDATTPRGKRGRTIRELQTKDMMVRRKRANRDLCARYEFVSLCEQLGATLITVPSRNTTRECPAVLPNGEKCGHIGENGPELLAACPACGTVRDKDRGAAITILNRAEEALANHAAE